jgi:hypothetical protein
MKTILLAAAAATAASLATATPIAAQTLTTETANVEQVRLVCDEYGRCYRTAPRYVQRYYNNDEGYVVRRGYGYYGGPGYYDRGYGYGYGGPGVGFSFGARGW